MKRVLAAIAIVIGASLILITRVPAALAFPYRASIGATQILSDTPINHALGARLARADALVSAAGLEGAGVSRTLVLTDGGWRWRLLSLQSHDAFGLRRPFSATLVFNCSDVAADRIYSNRAVGNVRSLSGVVAHETAHLLAARRIGEFAAMVQPGWKWEGFADHVAQESTLSAAQAGQLRRTDPSSKALFYFDARRRVAAELHRNPSIDALFH
ncbi:hypothetical protein [Sphingomonas sp. RS2018]